MAKASAAPSKCPHCGKSIKGHAGYAKGFRELTKTQRVAAIAKTAGDLNRMRAIHIETST